MPTRTKYPKANPFLAAICAHPDEDTPRLAYADWLDEHDDPTRAEFIRAQCELARLPAWDRRAKLLRMRERVLLARHGEQWRRDLPRIEGVTWGRFHRGFVSEVTVRDGRLLARKADAIRDAAPVTGVAIDTWEVPHGKSVKPLPWLRSVRVPGGGYYFSRVQFAALLDSPLFASVTRLDLSNHGVGNDAALALAGAGHLTSLDELDLSNCLVGDRGAEALAGCKHLSNLRVLRLNCTVSGYVESPYVTPVGLRALAASPFLPNLTALELRGQPVHDAGLRMVLPQQAFPRLESLTIGPAVVTDYGFEVPPGPVRLRELDLTGCQIGDRALAAAVKLPQLSSLARLKLRGCEIGPAGVAALAKSPAAKTLCELDLSHNPLRAPGAEEFARGKWPHLHTLNLSACALGTEAVRALGRSTGFGPLVDLDLSANEILAGGAIAVARAGWAAGLKRLNLAKCRCAAGAVLAESEQLRGLTELDLSDNDLGPAGVAALVAGAWPELTDLKLSGTWPREDGALALARSGITRTLLTLFLDRCGLTPAALEALLEGPAPGLVQLVLDNNTELGDDGARALADAKPLPALRLLSVVSCGLGTQGLNGLADSRLFGRLARFAYHGNQTSYAVSQRLHGSEHDPLPPDLAAAGFTAAGR